MSRPVSKLELIAFADGELSPSRCAQVEALLARNPELRAEVESLRALRSATARAMDHAPRNPALRRSVEAMFDEAAAVEQQETSLKIADPTRPWLTPRRLALAAALLLAFAAAAWVVLPRNGDPIIAVADDHELLIELKDGRPPVGIESRVILVAVRKHVTCAQMSDHFYDSRFPRVIGELSTPAAQFLGADPVLPDLSSLGYEFAGAGGCSITGGKTLHALYRSSGQAANAISVFVQPFEGQVSFEADQLLILAGPTSKHDMLVWRTASLVFFLVGDEVAATRQAADQMARRLQG